MSLHARHGKVDHSHLILLRVSRLSPRKEGTCQAQSSVYHACMTTKRVLFLAAEPTDEARLRLGQEQREIRNVLQLARARDAVEFHDRFAVRPADLTQALHDVNPHIVHFSGHGSSSGDLCFEDNQGNSRSVAPEALGALFRLFAHKIEAVVLNACYSESQASEIAQSVDYVVGMSDSIGDEAAINFSAGFYKALGAERTYLDSFDFGVAEMRLHGMPDHSVPILHKKRGPAHTHSNSNVDRDAYAEFRIRSGRWSADEGSGILVDTEQIPRVRGIIEMLYESYLADRVPPLTYGADWIVTGANNEHHLLAPATWVRTPDKPVRLSEPTWSDQLLAADCGIVAGSRWIIRLRDDQHLPFVESPFAVSSSNPDVLKILRGHLKGFMVLADRFVEASPESRLEEESGSSVVVLEDWTNSGVGGQWLLDRGGEVSEHIKFYGRY